MDRQMDGPHDEDEGHEGQRVRTQYSVLVLRRCLPWSFRISFRSLLLSSSRRRCSMMHGQSDHPYPIFCFRASKQSMTLLSSTDRSD